MEPELIKDIQKLNPWLLNEKADMLMLDDYIDRLPQSLIHVQVLKSMWFVLTGPRQAGKTTLGKYLCQQWIREKHFDTLLYLNCDFLSIRKIIINIHFIDDLIKHFALENKKIIFFIDEIQRIENAGLLMKAIIDLKLPHQFVASGSSQLEMKSNVQEFLTGRQINVLVLPLNQLEINNRIFEEEQLIYGCYPKIVRSQDKHLFLKQLYSDYINKDIIEILKVSKPDTMELLLTLIAHSSGQMVNYQQLATDCRVNFSTIQHYLGILEKTFVIKAVQPFFGNKRQEITSNPIYYFIDNGFRNQSLDNFTTLANRTDIGFLIQSAVFQELYKYQEQPKQSFSIHYWRTKGGAEVDFIVKKGMNVIPIEVKYRHMTAPKISRGFRSFIEAYEPKIAFYVTKNFRAKLLIEKTVVHFIPFSSLNDMLFQFI